MAQEGDGTPPSATPTPSVTNPFSPGAVSPLQPLAASSSGPQVYQVHTPPNETASSGAQVPFSGHQELGPIMAMMAQTLQAVQAQTQAVTQLASVLANQQQQQQQHQQQPQVPQFAAPPSVSAPLGAGERVEGAGKLDMKWLPPMPLPGWKAWKDRITEIHEYSVWLEAFTNWVSVLHNAFGPEIQEAVSRGPMERPLTHDLMNAEQIQRSQRILHLLRQAFAGFGRVESVACLLDSVGGAQRASGYELLRRITNEFSLQSRNEALHYRNQLLSYQVPHGTNLLETVRLVEVAVNKYHRMLEGGVGLRMPDLRVQEADVYLIYLRNVPAEVKKYVQLHARNETVKGVKEAIETYYIRTRVIGDTSFKPDGLHSLGGKEGKGGGKGSPKCWNCGRSGHVSKDCWDAQPEGKGGKEKQGKGGKSQAKAEKAAAGGGGGASTPRSANKSGTRCWKCGEKGHVAVDCKKPKQEGKGKGKQKKGKQRSLTEEEGQSEAEPEGETIMALNSSEISVVAERTGARIAGVCSVKGQTEAWLVDSGATSHVMTREALRRYEVVRVHHSVPKLWSAAEERIPTYGLVDLRVQFGKSRFVVTDVIVAEVSFCVLSSFALAQHDWVTHLSRKAAALTKAPTKGQVRQKVSLKMEARAWWAVAQLKDSVPEHPDLPALLSESARVRSDGMEIDGGIRELVKLKPAAGAQDKGWSLAHEVSPGDHAHEGVRDVRSEDDAHGATEKKANRERSAVKSILRRSSTCLDQSMPFHYMMRVMRSEPLRVLDVEGLPPVMGPVTQPSRTGWTCQDSPDDAPDVLLGQCPQASGASTSADALSDLSAEVGAVAVRESCLLSCKRQGTAMSERGNSTVTAPNPTFFDSLAPEMCREPVDLRPGFSSGCGGRSECASDLQGAGLGGGAEKAGRSVSGSLCAVRGILPANAVEHELRGLPRVVIDEEPQIPPTPGIPSSPSTSVEGEGRNREDLPPQDVFEDDVDLDGAALDAHRARGHFPFMRECVECRECKGMIPARSRRVKAAEEHLGIGADFVFFGRYVRIALFLALGTGMICAFRVEASEAYNVTQTVQAFKELGGTGRSVEFLSDCDDYLVKLVRDASKRDTFGSKGVIFRPAPVGRAQYKGRIERMVRTFKEGVNVNWVQLEKAIEAKISYEAPLMSNIVRYVSRCQNIHNKMGDSGMSPLDRLREKCESSVPTTWPFGVIGFAKPCHPNRVPYRGKRLVSSVYLGPCASVGSGCLCLPLEGDYESPRCVDEFSVFRPSVPLTWSRAGIEPLAIPRPVQTASEGLGEEKEQNATGGPGLLKRRRSGPTLESTSRPVPEVTCVPEVEMPDIEDLAVPPKPANLEEDAEDEPMYSPSLVPEGDPSDLPPLGLTEAGTIEYEKPGAMDVDGSLFSNFGVRGEPLGPEYMEEFALKFGSLLTEPNDDETALKYWWDEQLHAFLSKHDTWQLHESVRGSTVHDGRSFEMIFGGKKIEVLVPVRAWDEMTGVQLDRDQLEVGLRTEMQALEKTAGGNFLGRL